ncbi:MAG: DUF4013 domain-containing protein [Halodesulfurarchaeum sp.]
MLEDGLSYPARGDWIGRIIIGGVLGFAGFLVIPLFALGGYLFRVMEGTIEGKDVPPEFTDWGDLIVGGIGVAVVGVVYSFVPLLLWGFVTFTLIGAGDAVGGDAGGFVAGIGVLSMLLLIPVLVIVYFLVPAAIGNYARTGELKSAFDFGAILEVVTTGDYVLAVVLPIVVAILLQAVGFVLALTLVGVVLIPFVQFYGQVAVFRMFGLAFRDVDFDA